MSRNMGDSVFPRKIECYSSFEEYSTIKDLTKIIIDTGTIN